VAAIEVNDLWVVRGERVVLPGLSAEIEAGSVSGLLGPSGSGKSTLMRAIVASAPGSPSIVVTIGATLLALGAATLRRRTA
jgi:ABC-2 type transport system ATP-binding protein